MREKEAKKQRRKDWKETFYSSHPSGAAQISRPKKAKAAKYSVYGFDYRIKWDFNIS